MMKIIYILLLVGVNSFIRTNVGISGIIRTKILFCSNSNDVDSNGSSNKKEPTRISINSVNELFKTYLKIQEDNENIIENINIPIIKKPIPPPPPEQPVINAELEKHNDDLLKINKNIQQYKLLNKIKNDKISSIIKLELIEYNNGLFDNEMKLSNGGLFDDWNMIL